MPKIISLIAAAGQSMRMGYPKALLPIDGDYAVISLAKTLFYYRLKTWITLPYFLYKNHQLRHQLALYDTRLCLNAYDQEGFSGSIKTVLEHSVDSDGIIIIPVDAPYLSPSLLLSMITLARCFRTRPTILVPYAYGLAGHPVYFSHHFFADLFKGHILGGPRGIIQRSEKYVHRILWSDARIVKNLNYPHEVDIKAYNQNLL